MDSIFIQSTAWFLGLYIIIITTTSTEDHPYITISGNLLDEHIPCQGIPLTIGSKSNVHFQSLLPLEVRVPRHSIEPRSPEDTINMKVSATTSSQQNEYPGPDLDSREDFPELKPSRSNQTAQPKTLTRRKEIEKSNRQNNATDMTKNKAPYVNNHDQKKTIYESSKQSNENKIFKYEQQSKILHFEFMSDKRVRCPTCTNELKNIIRHLQRSGCGISNTDDFSEKFKQFKKVHLAKQIKYEQRKWG